MEKIKQIWQKILSFFGKVKSVFKKVVSFLKKYGKWVFHGINLVVVGIAYASHPNSLFVGGWLFLLLAYYIFWKLLRAETLFEKKEDDRPPLPGV